jgi:Smg protein
MFGILMYLFESYIHNEADIFAQHNELTDYYCVWVSINLK